VWSGVREEEWLVVVTIMGGGAFDLEKSDLLLPNDEVDFNL